MEQEYVDGYIHTRKHDFEVDVNNVNYNKDHIHLYVWVVCSTSPEFQFITTSHIERAMLKPDSRALIDVDGEMHLKHGTSKWFRAKNKDISICKAIKKAYEEWSIEEILMGGNHEETQ